MTVNILDISKQIYKEDLSNLLEKRYSTLGPMWVTQQMEWNNGVYSSFKDHDKFLIVILLVKKTLDFYSRNFTKLTYDEFYLKDIVKIEKFTISEISKVLEIPKESTRRKVIELEELGVLRKNKKCMVIDRSKFHFTKPKNTIVRISRFLAILSEMCLKENILLKKITSEELEIVIKNNFSYIWKMYYELQIPTMINYKKIFKDLETFHIFGTCAVNQHLFAKNIPEVSMDRNNFIKNISTSKMMQGINAMSISDITGIPRATVIRKLKKLVKFEYLSIDHKKHYRLTGNFSKQIMPVQKKVFTRLANFSAQIFNLHLLEKKI